MRLPLPVRRSFLLSAPLAAVLAGCDGAEETVWVRFNGDDTIQVEVTAAPVPDAAAATADLLSTTGAVVVGSATVAPGAGPVGTAHAVTAIVLDEFEAEVGRVTLLTDAGDRGVEEHELRQDSADRGLWRIDMLSAGESGEVRTDTFAIRLWSEEDAASVDDTDAVAARQLRPPARGGWRPANPEISR